MIIHSIQIQMMIQENMGEQKNIRHHYIEITQIYLQKRKQDG